MSEGEGGSMKSAKKGIRAGIVVLAGVLLLGVSAGITTAAASSKPAGHAPKPGYGQLPPVKGKVKTGGTMTVAQISGITPNYIFPITPAANLSVYTADFEDFMWRPLWWSPNGDSVPSIDETDSIADAPVFTDSNKVLTIHLKSYKWSNGQPVTSTDAIFDYWLFKAAVTLSPANEGDYTPGLYPDNVVSITAPNSSTIVVKWNKTYNQDFLLYEQIGDLEPLPASAWAKTSATGPILGANSGPNGFENLTNAEAIYKFLSGQASDLGTYATNPLWQTIDGPFKLTSFDAATDAFTMVPNPSFSGHHPYISKLEFLTYTSDTAEFDALLSNAVDVGPVEFDDLAKVPALKSNYYVWGEPNFGWEYVVYNFKDKTGDFDKIINQLYVRQALAHLQNETAEIDSKGILDGAGYPAYGPVPSVPPSPLAPSTATTDPYPFSVSSARKLLTSHGWFNVKPGKTAYCAKPGTKSDECGAGIPKGTKLSFNLTYTNLSPIPEEDETWASEASQVGIKIKLIAKTFDFIISNYSDVSAPKNENSWATVDFGGFTGVEYPTTNEVFNTTGSFNFGGFSNSVINTAIRNSLYSLNDNAVKREAELVGKIMPGMFQPNPDLIYAFTKTMSATGDQYLDNLSQYTYNPEYWYFKK